MYTLFGLISLGHVPTGKSGLWGDEQKVPDFTACPWMVVGTRSDWTEVALFPPVLPELAAWERCTQCKNHVNIKRDVHFQTWNQT